MWEEVVNVLGGRRVFGAPPNKVNLAEEITRGFPTTAYEIVAQTLRLNPVEADAVLRVSARTRTRWKERSRIDPDSSDKLARLARIYTLALDVLEKPEIAVAWMRESVAGLGGTRPIEAIATDAGAEQVSNLLHQMEYGIYA